MSKTSMLTARIEPELKTEAEDILSRLGISAGSAITMFYRQIVLQRAIPFPLTLHHPALPDLGQMTRADFDREMQLGDNAIRAGKVQPAAEAFADLRAALTK